MKLRIDVHGLKPMQKKMLKAMDLSDLKPVVMRNTAQLQQKAQQKAPVSTEKTNPGGAHGQLKRSILLTVNGLTGTVRATADYAQYVELGQKAPVSTEKTNPGGAHGQLKRSILLTVNGLTGTVRATADYAQYVELGTRFMGAQPYMRPALEEQGPVFLRDIKKTIARKFK